MRGSAYLRNFFAIYFICVVAGCDCVPEIDTDKNVYPETFANVYFVAASPDLRAFDVEADGFVVAENLSFENDPDKYAKIGADARANLLRLLDSKSGNAVYATSVDFPEESYWTMFVFGSSAFVETVSLEDDVESIDLGGGVFRVINFVSISDSIKIKLTRDGSTISEKKIDFLSSAAWTDLAGKVAFLSVEVGGKNLEREIQIKQGFITNALICPASAEPFAQIKISESAPDL